MGEDALLLIALGHTSGVGKDSVARSLERHGFRRIAFADKVRELTYNVDEVVRGQVDTMGWDMAKRACPYVRRKLVEVGRESRRVLGVHVWVDALFADNPDISRAVITDLRYPNEVEDVTAVGGFLVKVERAGVWAGYDPADQALIGFRDWDYVLKNDGTLSELDGKVDALLDWCSIAAA